MWALLHLAYIPFASPGASSKFRGNDAHCSSAQVSDWRTDCSTSSTGISFTYWEQDADLEDPDWDESSATAVTSSWESQPFASVTSISTTATEPTAACSSSSTQFHLSDPPYENYFYSDCNLSAQVVVTSPLSTNDLTIIGPRLLVAWPAGNSGGVVFFEPDNGVNGSLGIQLTNFTPIGESLVPYYQATNSNSLSGNPRVGVTGSIQFNSSAVLTIYILGSIRTIRDFVEGPSILVPEIQDAITFSPLPNAGVSLSRIWLDNRTTTELIFEPQNGSSATINGKTVRFDAGTYNFTATFDYPQLDQLTATEVLAPQSQYLITQQPEQTESLSFLSYNTKLLAGGWRFLTYFGRDSMISLLLLQPVLSEGQEGAIEAVISAVLERVNRSDGSVCHEETIGDYATYLNQQAGIDSTAPQYDYKMIDSDYYLPVVVKNYFVDTATGQNRSSAFFATNASVNPANVGLTYSDLALITAEKIMNTSGPFASPGGQTRDNLIHLKDGQVVGQWRDSTYGIGDGRIPYDVNTALVPAALRAISALSNTGFFPQHPDWNSTAAAYSQVWEDATLSFFEVTIPVAEAQSLVEQYVQASNFSGPANTTNLTSDVTFHGLALDGNDNQSLVRVMNTDDCFRHFLLNTTNQAQLTAFVNQTATHILQTFPLGLSTSVGMLISNPAYGGDPVYAANWTTSAYHGTVVWSWPLAMMAAGLERQLGRCNASMTPPDFCADGQVYGNVRAAYNHLWDLIQANAAQLTQEVWSWVYTDDGFQYVPLGSLPPPPGMSPTESDVIQLWSLTFLAVTRNENLS